MWWLSSKVYFSFSVYIAAGLIGGGELLVTVQVLLDSCSFFGLYY